MKNRISAPFILSLLLLLLHGCASTYSVVEFEVLEPASVSLPGHVQQLIILNRAPFTRDAFQKEDLEGVTDRQMVLVDTLIVNSLNRGLQSILLQSPIERFHHPTWISDRRRDTASLDDLVLTKREVNALCREMGGDAILSLESYTTDLEEHYNPSVEFGITHYYSIASTVKWMIYLPDHPKPFNTYTLVDTLFFTRILDGVVVKEHSAVEMLAESFFVSGAKYGRYLVPVWVHAARTLYRGREDSLKLAAQKTDEGEWDEAYGIWQGLLFSSDSTVMAKAYHNMAVYHELEDDLDSALILIRQAMVHDSLDNVKVYAEELETRVENRKELYEQVR